MTLSEINGEQASFTETEDKFFTAAEAGRIYFHVI